MNRKAILMVSFGTSNLETKEKTIDRIEKRIRETFTQCKVYTAFTSEVILRKLRSKYDVHVYSVEEAMAAMIKDQIVEIIVQPTHILDGIENHRMLQIVKEFQQEFKSISVGAPLLHTQRDYEEVILGLIEVLPKLNDEEAILFMGHGSESLNNTYGFTMNQMLKKHGCANWYMAMLEGEPYIWDILNILKQHKYHKIFLTPFLIVAGMHATKDMVGEKEDSWKNILFREGYEVESILRGLGEYEFIAELIIKHINEAQKL